ncbi:MAG: hypothetical protein AAFY41_07985 [Bacteroidota bacterium]
MKKILVLILVTISFSCWSQKYTLVKIGPEQNISMKIPDSFMSMTDQDRMKQVYSTKVPLAMYANESQEVLLGVNYNIMQWTEKDTDLVYGFYKASVNNLFDEVEFIQDEIKEINGRTFIVFEIIGSIRGDNTFSTKAAQKNYSYIQYTSWNDQVLLFNFSCKNRLRNQWEGIAKEIMESIKIKE